ncbi:hypothetical protein QQF64_024445 [Cirrhinus molitorella]|uniref:Dynein light chain n=6 Tax=Cyprinidae TaxID=7953 RepID=A0ABR3NL86_9TELE
MVYHGIIGNALEKEKKDETRYVQIMAFRGTYLCTALQSVKKRMAETGDGKKEDADYKRLQSFPLIRHTDMPEEMRVETMELCVTACEKFASNNESAAKMIKESMDKKFGSSWHVVIGEGFGFEVSHEVRNLLYMFFGGSLAVCVWKCS